MKKLLSLIIAIAFAFGLKAQTVLDEAPDFTAVDYFGNEIHLYDILEGGQYVVLHINTRTNAATPEVTPPLVKAYTKFGCNLHDVFFIGVVPNGTSGITKKYVEAYGIEFPMIHNSDESYGMEGPAMDIWQAHSCNQPTTMLIAPDKKILIKDISPLKEVEDVVAKLTQYGIEEHSCDEVPEEPEITLAAPTLKAEAISKNEISLTWNKVENATSYNVYQGEEIVASNLSDTTYLVKNLLPNTEYCFSVTALYDKMESEKSEVVCGTTLSGEGLSETKLNNFNIYPNPAKEAVRIMTEMRGEAEIEIYDMTGRCVKNVIVAEANNATINISDIEKGIYIINIDGNKEKLIIE